MSNERLVEIIVGSKTDLPHTQGCKDILSKLGIPWELSILSAHRHPRALGERANDAVLSGVKAIICFAGMSAQLPGAVGALTAGKGVMVIGVALPSAEFPDAMDALLAMTRLPPGLGVVCAGIGAGAGTNAALFAAEALAGGGFLPLEKLILQYKEMNEAKPPQPGLESGPKAEKP